MLWFGLDRIVGYAVSVVAYHAAFTATAFHVYQAEKYGEWDSQLYTRVYYDGLQGRRDPFEDPKNWEGKTFPVHVVIEAHGGNLNLDCSVQGRFRSIRTDLPRRICSEVVKNDGLYIIDVVGEIGSVVTS